MSLRRDLLEIAPGELRQRLEGGEGGAKIAGQEGDVRVHQEREGRADRFQRLVGGAAETARLFVAEQPHRRLQAGDDGRRARGIVHHDDLRDPPALALEGSGHFHPPLEVVVDGGWRW